MAIGTQIKQFGKTPIGFLSLTAVIVLLSGFLVGELGIPVGALLMLIVAFGFPIYFGWKTSLKRFLAVALAVLLFAPLVTGLTVTPLVYVPSATSASNDNVLQNASVSPWSSVSSGQVYHFQVQVWPDHVNKSVTLDEVYLWITNCEYDTDTSHGNCYLTASAPFLNETQKVTTSQQNSTGPFWVYFNETGLKTGQIYYFMFLTAVSYVAAESTWIYAFNSNIGGWSCTSTPGYTCTYTQGPITTNWGGVYVNLLPDFYISMLLLVAVLVAIILIYTYLKGRERARLAKAKAAAGGGGEKPLEERRCPHCGAVVDKGETTCWKCKKDLSAPPSGGAVAGPKSPPPSGGSAASGGKDQPLPSSGASPVPETGPDGESATPSTASED